ncbi:MAG: hypothetical protein IT497_03845 [Ottowia sp.]|nr:hypothetical protein [Ottowia sp.]
MLFNLIVKGAPWIVGKDTFPASRVFEDTEPTLIAQYKPNGRLDFTALSKLPTIFVEETSGQDKQVARVGFIRSAQTVGQAMIMIEYGYDPKVSPIPNKIFEAFAVELGIDKWQFRRTHWSINSGDLFQFLLHHSPPRRHCPAVFTLSEQGMIEPKLISAMMPFHPGFNPVYEALQEVALAVGMRCQRADDIWENPSIIQDVVSLIDRSCIVICDCSERNPNVFYEMGIAHTLGREVILITRSSDDIPFDVKHLRHVKYLGNGEGLAQLKTQLRQRIESVLNQ